MVSRKRKIEKIGFFLTDASFDHKTKVASIAILDLKKNTHTNVQKQISNPKEAESLGIIEALHIANNKYESVIVFCDNINSVNEVRRKVLSSNFWKNKFFYVQLVWVPREETHLADFFSKNLDSSAENLSLKIDSFKKECESSNVMDIVITKSDKINILNEFKELLIKDNNWILKINLKSILKDIFLNKYEYNKLSSNQISLIKEDAILIYKEEPILLKKGSVLHKLIQGLINI